MNSALEPYGGDYFSFVLIGFAFTHYLRVSLQGFSKSIRQNQLMGIMELLLVTDTKLSTLIVSSSLYKFLFTSIQILIFLVLGIFIFSINISNANYAAAFVFIIIRIVFSFHASKIALPDTAFILTII